MFPLLKKHIERQRGREGGGYFHLLVHSPNAHNDQGAGQGWVKARSQEVDLGLPCGRCFSY